MNKYLAFISVVFLFVSCDSNVIYEENQSFEKNVWSYDDIKTFNFEIEEEGTPAKIFLNLRTTTDYPYSNIFFYLHREEPNGLSDIDTFEFFLAEPNGKWIGNNTGTVVENKIYYAGGVFSSKGKYTYKLEQAMREDNLPEVIDIGVRVERWDDIYLQK